MNLLSTPPAMSDPSLSSETFPAHVTQPVVLQAGRVPPPTGKVPMGALRETLLTLLDTLLPAPYYLLDCQAQTRRQHLQLTLFLERTDGQRITLDECALVHHAVAAWLEEGATSWLPVDEFGLEVSSPGLFRELKTDRELAFYQGSPVLVIQKRTPPGAPRLTFTEATLVAYTPDPRTWAFLPAGAIDPVTVSESVYGPLKITLNPPVDFSGGDT